MLEYEITLDWIIQLLPMDSVQNSTHFPPWINSFEHPTKNPPWTSTMYDSRPYVFYRNGESFQPEVSDQSQADWFHQWCQLSLCLHHFLPRDSEEHRQQRDLSGGLKGEWSCSEMCHFILAKFKTKRSAGPNQCRETCWIPMDATKITTTVWFRWNFKKSVQVRDEFGNDLPDQGIFIRKPGRSFSKFVEKTLPKTEFRFVFSFLISSNPQLFEKPLLFHPPPPKSSGVSLSPRQ